MFTNAEASVQYKYLEQVILEIIPLVLYDFKIK